MLKMEVKLKRIIDREERVVIKLSSYPSILSGALSYCEDRTFYFKMDNENFIIFSLYHIKEIKGKLITLE